ncbi:hypothetical protein MLD38_007129 [Melastoma candidum]|uniref:Uncharacterized protein n=1 Tax=Melastoma candidum TaxID=119954 RepID=A0ACB9RQ33_9MYRT|nr:hypothetical protein MLD38_007129 [Melastoma candidum]
MVHILQQPELIDSLATVPGYTYLLDMFDSPLLPPEEQQLQSQMNGEDITLEKRYDPNSYDPVAQLMPNKATEETPNHQINGPDKSFGANANTMTGSGSTRVPDIPKASTAMTVSKPKKKGIPWTKSEHALFLEGMERYGKGDWKSISQTHVLTRTAAQVASHAQKYFARLKRDEKTGSVGRTKAAASSKDFLSAAKPVSHPTVNVPPSGNDLVSPWKSSTVSHTIYAPPSDIFPSDADPYIPSMDLITNPTSDNNNLSPTMSVPPPRKILPDPNLDVQTLDPISAPSSTKLNVYPTFPVPPSSNIFNDPNGWILTMDYPKDLGSEGATVTPSDPAYLQDISFSDPDVYQQSLDLLLGPPPKDILPYSTFYASPSNLSTFDPTINMPPNDLTPANPEVSPFPPPHYYTIGHDSSFTQCLSDMAYLPPRDDAYEDQLLIERQQHLHPNAGKFISFRGF